MASQKDSEKLRADICSTLQSLPDSCSDINTFWNTFVNKHKYRPDPKVYGFYKRSELLYLFPKQLGFRYLNGATIVYFKTGSKTLTVSVAVESELNLNSKDCTSSVIMKEKRTKTGSIRQSPYSTPSGHGGTSHMSQNEDNSADDDHDKIKTSENVPQPCQHAAASSEETQQHSNQVSQLVEMILSNGPPLQLYSTGHRSVYGHHGLKVPLEALNSIAEEFITRIAENNEYVSVEKVASLLFARFRVRSINDLGLRNITEIKCINELKRLESRINATIQAFLMMRSICTLHDLNLCLVDLLRNKSSNAQHLNSTQADMSSVHFEDFKLGPLTSLPIIYDYFRVEPGSKVYEITTTDLLRHLSHYICEENKWNEQISLDDFMKYLSSKCKVQNAFDLGVVITSLPLAIQAVKKASRDKNNSFKEATEKLQTDMQNSLRMAFNHFRDSILHQISPSHVYPMTGQELFGIRSEYFKQKPDVVIRNFFSKLHYMFVVLEEKELEGATDVQKKQLKKKKNRTSNAIKEFRDILQNDKVAGQLVQIAVCCSQEQISYEISKVFGSSGCESSGDGMSSANKKKNPGLVLSSEQIVQKVLKYLSSCFESGPLSLKVLSNIEEKLLDDMKVQHFGEFFKKGFLAFLLTSSEIIKMLEDNNGVVLGASSATTQNGCYKASNEEIKDFLCQCIYYGARDRLDVMKMAICQHFGVVDIREAGCHGDLSHSIKTIKSQTHSGTKNVIYEAALLGKQFKPAVTHETKVGLWGLVKREQALLCLHNCPLLNDLSKWSNWDVVFRPELGDLKSFVRQNGGMQQISLSKIDSSINHVMQVQVVALETKPGVLLKLALTSSLEDFENGVKSQNPVGTSGHFVSCLVSQGGVESFSEELFANRLKTSLIGLGNFDDKEDKEIKDLKTASFILDCILMLPDLIAVSLVQKVFLKPVSEVFGQARTKELLTSAASNNIEKINKLELLGFSLGIPSWFEESFSLKLKPNETEKMLVAESSMEINSSSNKRKRAESGMSQSKVESESRGKPSKKVAIDISSDESSDSSDDESLSSSVDKFKKRGVVARKSSMVLSESSSSSSSDEGDDLNKMETVEYNGSSLLDHIRGSLNQLKNKNARSLENFSTKDGSVEKVEMEVITEDSESLDGGEACQEQSCSEAADRDVCQHWQELVEDIRRKEFGVGFNLEGEGMELLKKQQDRLGRSLERLSIDLYSKDTHFVLELVQNADDNRYSEHLGEGDNGYIVPSLLFTLRRDVIVVSNNEIGFRDMDLRAVCDVGKTTKGKHKTGYIGQKGIGFKSVFRVTSQPEIHSRGLHIKFDVNSGSLGYILPHWIGVENGFYNDEKIKENEARGYTTQIVLPLKDGVKEIGGVQSSFRDLHPSLLLFLHRLKQIVVNDETSGETRFMLRNDLSDHVTEIIHDGGKEKWMFVKKVVDASEVSKEAKSGVEVLSTELAMAFPVEDCESDTKKKYKLNSPLPPKQPVYAFLPLRSYGFRFIIHADFDVPSSREDVVDSLWNQWLRSKIHVLFLEALEFFKSREGFDPITEVCSFFKFVPREDEILDFFRQVALNIINSLKVTKCLPSAGNKWCLPSQLLLCDDPKTRKFATYDLLSSQMDLDYLHPLVASSVDRSVLLDVGVQLLNSKHLVQVGRAMIRSISQSHENESHLADSNICQISSWLTCIYRSLNEFSTEWNETIELMKKMSFIPLSSGKLVGMDSNETIFFPFSSEKHLLGGSHLTKNMMKLLEQDMNSVDSRLMTLSNDDVVTSQVTSLLEKIGVKKLSIEDIVKHHILPSLKSSEKCKEMSKELLIVYTFYLKYYFTSRSSSCASLELSKHLPILTNKGFVKLSNCSVHFTPDYNNRIHLQQQLPGLKWTLLDKSYLDGNKSASNVSTWREFFKELGVQDFLAFTKKERVMNKVELLSSSWHNYVDLLEDASSCTIEDWVCDEFTELIEPRDDHEQNQQIKVLFELLNRFWEEDNVDSKQPSCSGLSQYVEAVFKVEIHDLKQVSFHSSTMIKTRCVPSSFGLSLKSSKWLPTWKLNILSFDDHKRQEHIKKLKSCYENVESFLDLPVEKDLILSELGSKTVADSRIAVALLGHNVLYVPIKAEYLRKSLAKFLNIQTNINASYVVERLIDWCSGNSLDSESISDDFSPITPPTFHDLVSRMARVYTYLEDSLSKNELNRLTSEYPLIYCARDELSGSFYFSDEVCWEDITGLLEKYSLAMNTFVDVEALIPNERNRLVGVLPKILNKQYNHSKKDFFLRICNVSLCPSLSVYAQILVHITSSDSVNPSSLVDVLNIFVILGSRFVPESELSIEQKKVMTILNGKKFIPSKTGRWVGISDLPIVADDKQFEKIFAGTSVNYVDLGDKEAGKFQQVDSKNIVNFLLVVGAKRLTECVTVHPTTEMFRPCALLREYVSQVIQYVQRCLYSEFPLIYKHLVDDVDISSKISKMTFAQVGKLELVYILECKTLTSRNHIATVVVNKTCQMFDDVFYVHNNNTNNYSDINREMSTYFSRLGQPSPPNVNSLTDACFKELRSLLSEVTPHLIRGLNDVIENIMEDRGLMNLTSSEDVWNISRSSTSSAIALQPPSDTNIDALSAPSGGHSYEAQGIRSWPPMARRDAPANNSTGGVKKAFEPTSWPQPVFDLANQSYNINLPDNLKPLLYGTGQNEENEGSKSRSESAERNYPVVGRSFQNLPVADDNQVQVAVTEEVGMSSEISAEHFNGEVNNCQDPDSIGKWGELYVLDYLQKISHMEDSDIAEVLHMNNNGASTAPYDIVVKKKSDASSCYIEVKSTLGLNKTWFETSLPELASAVEFGPNYHVYRVFGVGQDQSKVRMTKIENLRDALSSKRARIVVVVGSQDANEQLHDNQF